jgi:hypothetical protein
MTLDHPVRSGLCHGPSCEQKITEKSQSRYFCSEGCQGRWSAAHVGAEVEPPTPFWSYVSNGWSFGSVREAVEALRLDLSLGARHHLTGGEYVVTESEPGRAVLSPVGEPAPSMLRHLLEDRDVPCDCSTCTPKPIRKSWWKPNTWRRHG